MTPLRPGRLAVVAALMVAPACALVSIGVGPAGAAGAATTVTGQAPDTPSVSVPGIIPQPNEGRAPANGTDPGGWAQYAVFWGMCGAIVVIVGLVFLESRRKLRRRAELEAADEVAQTRSSTRSDPVAESSENAPESSARR